MTRTTPILYVVLILISLTMSGCVEPDTQVNNVSTPTPTHTPTPMLTPMPTHTPTPTPTPTNESVNESIYDNRSAAWLYAHGYYGSSGGGRSVPAAPIPKTATIFMFACGILLLAVIWRQR